MKTATESRIRGICTQALTPGAIIDRLEIVRCYIAIVTGKPILRLVMIWVAAMAAGCSGAGPEVAASVISTRDDALNGTESAVIVVYDDSVLSGPSEESKVLRYAVWDDGRVSWRRGKDLDELRVDPTAVHRLIDEIGHAALMLDSLRATRYVGPDNPFTVMLIRLNGREVELASDHERLEGFGDVVVTSRGAVSREGRDSESVLAGEPDDYQRFRRLWNQVRQAVDSWLHLS